MDKSGLFIGLFFVVGLGYVGYQNIMKPDSVGHSMTPPDLRGVAAGAPLAEVAVPSEFSEAALVGQNIFNLKCAVCHGENAAGQNGVAPPLVHRIYEPSHHSDMAFVLAARNGVRAHHWDFGNMPAVEGLTESDVKMVATYVRELQRENGIN
ncbi:cytochrome C [Rhodobacteraceae bacterium (ex Bugula neritina AB1)]|nr:cytochrome C [Rhodobacteraceae bacterium (ex Bugula neritina AB1)]